MKTNPRRVFSTLVFLAILVVSVSANAEPVYNPNNGHYYERKDAAVNWYEARDMAEQMTWMGVSGHLATVTTEEENSWIVDNLGGAATLDHWLGAYQEDGSTNHLEGWHWVTGELWDYDFMLAMWWDYPTGPVPPLRGLEYDDDEGTSPTPGKWIGYPLDGVEEGFIVEYDTAPVPELVGYWNFDENTGTTAYDSSGYGNELNPNEKILFRRT